MPERPKPDLDQTREALRQHDARAESAEDEASEAEPEPSEPADDEDEER
jgi:hypothetical protein